MIKPTQIQAFFAQSDFSPTVGWHATRNLQCRHEDKMKKQIMKQNERMVGECRVRDLDWVRRELELSQDRFAKADEMAEGMAGWYIIAFVVVLLLINL